LSAEDVKDFGARRRKTGATGSIIELFGGWFGMVHSTATRRRQHRPVLLVGLVALSLASAGCGTRLSGDERAAARAGSGGATTVVSGAAGDTGTGTAASPDAGTGTAGGSDAGTGAEGSSLTGSDGTAAQGGSATGGATGTASTTGAQAGSGSTTTGGTGTRSPLVLASVGTFSGPGGAAWAPGVDGLKLWVKDVNRRGGVDGHPVSLLVADDGSDPARQLSIVKDFVENKNVFAFVYQVVSTTYSKALDDYLTQKGIPVIGGDTSAKLWETSKPFFPLGTTQSAAFFSHMKAAKLAHPEISKIAVLTCREAQGCTEASTGWPAAGKRVGFTTVYNAQVSIAQPDFTSECLNARNAGAEMMFVAVDPNSVRRLGSSCSRQGYKPIYVLPSGVIASGQKGDANLEGTLGVNLVMPWMSASTPGEQEFQAAVRRYNPGLALNITTPFGWVSGKMLEKAAAGRLGASPSRQAVFAGLYTFKGETLGGIAPPLTFTRTRKSADCWFTLLFKGGAWKESSTGRASCP
jgi:branched-chain amino acid transport system substrate-binding protein